MHVINNRNEETQAKILEFNADRMQQPFASAEIRVELYKIGLLLTINIYFLVIETFLNNVI